MGEIKHPGPGRPKGTKNKIGAQLREILRDFMEENFDKIREDFHTLSPRDRVKVYAELLPYVVPKLASTDSTISFERMTDEDLDRIIQELAATSAE